MEFEILSLDDLKSMPREEVRVILLKRETLRRFGFQDGQSITTEFSNKQIVIKPVDSITL